MPYLCLTIAIFRLEVNQSIITCVSSVRMSVSKMTPYASSSASPLALRLMESLEMDKPDPAKVAMDNIDLFSDHSEDDPAEECPVKKEAILTAGKYGKKVADRIPVGDTYLTDKGYCQWVRDHVVDGKSFVADMRKLRLYIEMRDNKKRARVRATSTTFSPPSPQALVTPKIKAKAKTSPAPTRSIPEMPKGITRKDREGTGWSSHDREMEIEEWESVSFDQVQVLTEECSNKEMQINQLRMALAKACMSNPTEENKKMLNEMLEQ